jgi:hypothetical protein
MVINASAQEKKLEEKKIPVNMITYLKQNYPTAKAKEYYQKKENDTLYYEVEFEVNRQEYNLKFSLSGALLETELEVEFEDITPVTKENIVAVLHEKFKKYRIKKTQELKQGGLNQFELNVKVQKSVAYKSGFYDLLFDSKGNLVRIEETKLNSIESIF